MINGKAVSTVVGDQIPLCPSPPVFCASIRQDIHWASSAGTGLGKNRCQGKDLTPMLVLIIVGTIVANIILEFPAVGLWGAILLGSLIRSTPWGQISKVFKGSLFLLSLVLSASLMPVKALPMPSSETTFFLGYISAFIDNIPLTALALHQGSYDWGILGYAIGYGGSMVWFSSSAGVAITTSFPETKNTGLWLKESGT